MINHQPSANHHQPACQHPPGVRRPRKVTMLAADSRTEAQEYVTVLIVAYRVNQGFIINHIGLIIGLI